MASKVGFCPMLRLLGCLNGESAALTSSPNIVASRYPHMCKSCSPFWNRLKMNKICNKSRTRCGSSTIFMSPRFCVKSLLANQKSTNDHFEISEALILETFILGNLPKIFQN